MAALIGGVGTMAVVGYFLPVSHTASRDAVIAAPAGEVFQTISDVERYPEWRSDVSRVDILSGGGSRVRFREHSSDGPVVMEIDLSESPVRFVTRIADPTQPFGGSWTFELTPAGLGTRVTITERGEVYNVMFRFLSRFVVGHTSGMERFLGALARKHR